MHIFALANEWLAIAGICICILFGYRRWTLVYLIAPAAVLLSLEYLVWPLLVCAWPSLWALLTQTWWLIALVLIASPLVAFVLGLRLVRTILTFLFGAHAVGEWGGEVLIRSLLGRRQGRQIPQSERPNA